jgi:surface glycoprotein (TIGR04207 family)/PGF-CTERM protein
MTGNNNKLRALFLTALMVFSVFAGTVALSGSATAAAKVDVDSAVEYDSGNVEVTLNNSLSSGITGIGTADEQVTVYVDGDKNPNAYTGGSATVKSDGTSQVVDIVLDQDVSPNQNLTLKFHDITSTGGDDIDVVAEDIDVTSATIKDTDSTSKSNRKSVRTGEPIAFVDEDTEDSQIEFGDITANAGSNSNVYNYDSANLDSGANYSVSYSTGSTQYFETKALGLSVSTENNITDADALEIDVDINRGGDAVARLYKSNGDHVDTIGKRTQGGKTTTFNFTSQSDNDYYVNVTDNGTGELVQTDTITVSKADEGTAGFSDSTITEHNGDVVEIPVEVDNTDKATVVVGSQDDGYYGAVEVTDDDDDGNVTLEWNTWNASGDGNNNPFTVPDGDDSIEAVNEGGDFTSTNAWDDLLDSGNYNVNATAGHQGVGSSGFDFNEDSVATIQLTERSTDSVDSWHSPSGAPIRSWDVASVQAGIGSNITETNDVANSSHLVTRVQVSGLEGLIASQDKGNVTQALLNNTGNDATDSNYPANVSGSGPLRGDRAGASNKPAYHLRLWVNETNPGQNTSPLELEMNATNTAVVADYENDTYYFASEVDRLNDSSNWGQRNTGGEGVAHDDKFKTNFSVIGASALETSSDDDVQSVNDTWKVVEPNVDLETNDDDEVEVQSATGQTLSGDSNLAPGTNVTVKLQSDNDDNPFLSQPEGEIGPNGTFVTQEKDFTDLQVETNLTLSVDQDGVSETWDGIVLEGSAANETETNTSSNETETEMPDTETEMPDTETEMTGSETEGTEETTTGGSGPGFTVVAALGALIAAALLAVRRNN